MERPYQHIVMLEPRGDVVCVRLARREYDDLELQDLGAEIARLIDEDGCRKLVLVLGPEDPKCLFSVFLAKLINLQRRLASVGGALALASLNDSTLSLFQAAGLDKFFQFFPDADAAAAAMP